MILQPRLALRRWHARMGVALLALSWSAFLCACGKTESASSKAQMGGAGGALASGGTGAGGASGGAEAGGASTAGSGGSVVAEDAAAGATCLAVGNDLQDCLRDAGRDAAGSIECYKATSALRCSLEGFQCNTGCFTCWCTNGNWICDCHVR